MTTRLRLVPYIGVLALLLWLLYPLVALLGRSQPAFAAVIVTLPILVGALAVYFAQNAEAASAGSSGRRIGVTRVRVGKILGIIALVLTIPTAMLLLVSWVAFGRNSLDSSCFRPYSTLQNEAQAGRVRSVQIAGINAVVTESDGSRWLVTIADNPNVVEQQLVGEGVVVNRTSELQNPPTNCSFKAAPTQLKGA